MSPVALEAGSHQVFGMSPTGLDIPKKKSAVNKNYRVSVPPSVVSREEFVTTVIQNKLPDISDMRPATVMHPKSTIAHTMLKARKRAGKKGNSSSSSTDSDSSSSSSSESSDSSSSSSAKAPSGKKRKCSKKKKKPNVKAIPPKNYSGDADYHAFTRFVKESEVYLEDSRFKKERYIFKLSYFLKGTAYDFYLQRVKMNEEHWKLNEFYRELFNFCFPFDYRMKLREKLDRTYQNDKSVIHYAHGIQELFNMIGNIREEDKVLKLWKGLKIEIQQGLWRDKLNPDLSTWDEVLVQVERIEMSIKTASSRLGKKPLPTKHWRASQWARVYE